MKILFSYTLDSILQYGHKGVYGHIAILIGTGYTGTYTCTSIEISVLEYHGCTRVGNSAIQYRNIAIIYMAIAIILVYMYWMLQYRYPGTRVPVLYYSSTSTVYVHVYVHVYSSIAYNILIHVLQYLQYFNICNMCHNLYFSVRDGHVASHIEYHGISQKKTTWWARTPRAWQLAIPISPSTRIHTRVPVHVSSTRVHTGIAIIWLACLRLSWLAAFCQWFVFGVSVYRTEVHGMVSVWLASVLVLAGAGNQGQWHRHLSMEWISLRRKIPKSDHSVPIHLCVEAHKTGFG